MTKSETIAVIGTGLAGLSAAHLLSSKHQVVLLEKSNKIVVLLIVDTLDGIHNILRLFEYKNCLNLSGFDLASVSVADVDGKELRIDSPMRGVTKLYYSTLCIFYKYLGLELAPVNVDASFSNWRGQASENPVYLTTNFKKMDQSKKNIAMPSSSHWLLPNWISMIWRLLPMTWDLITSPHHLKISLEVARLYLHALSLSKTKALSQQAGTIEQWMDNHYFSKEFQHLYLAPFVASLGTCTKEHVLAYPAKIILDMVSKWGDDALQVVGGVRKVTEKLLEPISEVVFNFEVVGVWKDADSDQILLMDQHGYARLFDKVVFAGSAHTCRKLLTAEPPFEISALEPQKEVISILERFTFVPVRVVVHSDSSLLPLDKSKWRGFNLAVDEAKNTMATIWVNYLQNVNTSTDYFETSSIVVNPEPKINTKGILSEHIFPRSIVTHDSLAALDELEKYQGQNGFFFCGSWAWPGMPLLEGCVASAIRVSERLGGERPWKVDGSETCVWSKTDDDLDLGLVDRYLDGNLRAGQKEPGIISSIVVSFFLVYLRLILFLLTKSLGVYRASVHQPRLVLEDKLDDIEMEEVFLGQDFIK